MSAFTFQPAVSKAALALRAYLATAPQAELDARLARVQALGLPKGPTLAELAEQVGQQARDARTQPLPVPPAPHFTGSLAQRDVPAGEYTYAMAA